MRDFLRAELRKSWKTKKFMNAILCFLAFMSCSYIFCIQKDLQYNQELVLTLHYQNRVTNEKAGELLFELQHTPVELEKPGMRERYNLLAESNQASYSWSMERQAPTYFGWDKITKAAHLSFVELNDLMISDYYEGELDDGEQSLQDVEDNLAYYTYLVEHDIPMYSSPYQPTLLNFFVQIFQNETMILFIMIAAFIMADQICHDFDHGTYKLLYALPLSRMKVMCIKVCNAMIIMIIAFILAFLIFAAIPLLQQGLGSFNHPYMVNHTIISYLPLCMKMIPLTLLVMLFYMSVCTLLSTTFKNTTNTLLIMSGILLMVYLSGQFFGLHNQMITWLPFFYLYPLEIISGGFDFSYVWCCIICILMIVMMIIYFNRRLEKRDLKGSEAS